MTSLMIPMLAMVGLVAGLVGAGAAAAQETPPAQPVEPASVPDGHVRCLVTDNGKQAPGELSVADGRRVGCNQGLPLPPGLHRVRVHLAESDDDATETRWVQVASGMSLDVTVGFETGELVLLSQSGVAPMPAEADLWSEGAVRAKLASGVPAKIRVGIYVVDARTKAQSERFEAVHVSPRGRTALIWQVKP